MKKIRKHTQLNFLNPKRAGRPAIHDPGIRHIRRLRLKKASSLHLTIKVRENKADIQSKRILKALHHAIIRARLKGLRVVHYTLEYNHVHLLVESVDNKILHKGMQAFGITIAKAINKISMVVEAKINVLYPKEAKKIWADIQNSEFLRGFQVDLYRVLSPGEIYFKSMKYAD